MIRCSAVDSMLQASPASRRPADACADSTLRFAMPIAIGSHKVGAGSPSFLILEAGVNHNGDLDRALALVDAAAAAGADAVKFQTFRTSELVTAAATKAEYQRRTTAGAEDQADMLRRLELGEAEHRALIDRCHATGILFLSTPYDRASVDLLVRLGVAALKIASTDTTNVPFLEYCARTGLPLFVSTGMSTIAEVDSAVSASRRGGCRALVLLHCTSEYPAPAAEANLRAMETLHRCFGVPVGFSDHTEGIDLAPVAVALGASVIEKHFTLSRALPGPDHAASIEPAEATEMIRSIRRAEAALGDGVKTVVSSEAANKSVMQKSLVAARDLRVGETLTAEMLAAKRPATGLPPAMLPLLVGARLKRDLARDTRLELSALDFPDGR